MNMFNNKPFKLLVQHLGGGIWDDGIGDFSLDETKENIMEHGRTFVKTDHEIFITNIECKLII